MPMGPQLRNPDQGVIHSPLKKANLSLRLKKKPYREICWLINIFIPYGI